MARYRNTIEAKEEETFSISQFLSTNSNKRNVDKVFIRWFEKKDDSNPKKTAEEWAGLMNSFLSSTEK